MFLESGESKGQFISPKGLTRKQNESAVRRLSDGIFVCGKETLQPYKRMSFRRTSADGRTPKEQIGGEPICERKGESGETVRARLYPVRWRVSPESLSFFRQALCRPAFVGRHFCVYDVVNLFLTF